MKVLGLDVGEKRIGVAVSDALGLIAQGITVLQRRDLEYDLRQLQRLVKETDVSQVVVGIPKNMDGSLGEGAKMVLLFVEQMRDDLAIPVILWDERWTTTQATRVLVEADLSRKKRRKVVDKLAAVLILQNYLDSGMHDTSGGDQA